MTVKIETNDGGAAIYDLVRSIAESRDRTGISLTFKDGEILEINDIWSVKVKCVS